MSERTYTELVRKPIPIDLPSVAGWKEVPIQTSNEKLVPIGPFSDHDDIFTDSIYYGEMINSPYMVDQPQGSLVTMFVREGVANQLKKAQSLLPQEYRLVVFDAFRTLNVQQSLFDRYFSGLKELRPQWSEEQLLAETQKYVSLPSTDPTRPSPHNTGGAVDLAIFKLPEDVVQEINGLNGEIRKISLQFWRKRRLLAKYPFEMRKYALMRTRAEMLNFGTPFDWGGSEAALNYFEKLSQDRELTQEEQVARGNRRLLYGVMTAAGMQPYEDEWWHYNSPKSQMGARVAGLPFASYGPVELSLENLEHEKMRQDHRKGTISLSGNLGNKLGFFPTSEVFQVAYLAAQKTGDPRTTSLPTATIIAPS